MTNIVLNDHPKSSIGPADDRPYQIFLPLSLSLPRVHERSHSSLHSDKLDPQMDEYGDPFDMHEATFDNSSPANTVYTALESL